MLHAQVSPAAKLSALLTVRALDVYSRMEEDANDYDKVKEALLKRYDFTEDGYKIKFRETRPEVDESQGQFMIRLQNFLDRWVRLAKVEKSYGSLTSFFVREQFMNAAPRDLAVHLRERAAKTVTEMAEVSEHFLVAHGRKFGANGKLQTLKDNSEERSTNNDQNREKKGFRCDKAGHFARDCTEQITGKQAGSAIQVQLTQGFDDCIEDGQLVLANGMIKAEPRWVHNFDI